MADSSEARDTAVAGRFLDATAADPDDATVAAQTPDLVGAGVGDV